jgi:hypothetical protein
MAIGESKELPDFLGGGNVHGVKIYGVIYEHEYPKKDE